MMPSGHLLVLPSANSAFRRTVMSRSCQDVTSVCVEGISPSLNLRKRLTFDGNPLKKSNVKAEVSDELWNDRIAFVSRWKMERDVAIHRTSRARIEPIKKAEIPRCDWTPIERPSNKDMSYSDHFELNNKVNKQRPFSPVPFSYIHQQTRACDVTRANVLLVVPESCLTPPASPDLKTKAKPSQDLCEGENIGCLLNV